ncbi:hypothetical protein [Pelodictyon luteolum]|uniref:Uncharacterized protein n=1 Tax=Chlorobium luteolum (strain DSM 273 / BCRC 81028 / 2530) TaxID=319225 RepID=Q3B6N2_CHLL3|nr:hypothetical protein [Pelodictyon luteolum]ABB22999.1 conserved hypothetical protein [Pelodictyon luteolum DSM 273]
MVTPMQESFQVLVERPPTPCLSLYQETHRSYPDNRQDRLRYKNLVNALEESLRRKYPGRDALPLLEPFRVLGDDDGFWNHTHEGLAVFGAEGIFRTYRFPYVPRELAVSADSFHTKPLLRVMQSTERFHLLCLTRQNIKLYDADRYAVEEIELPPDMPRNMLQVLGSETTEPEITIASFGSAGAGGVIRHGHSSKRDEEEVDNEKFFRAVDTAVLERYSIPSGLPLMLAALPEHQGLFRKISRNASLLEGGISADPQSMTTDVLRVRAWDVMAPSIAARIRAAAESCAAAIALGTGTSDPEDAAVAAVGGRIERLLIDRETLIAGTVDPVTGAVRFVPLEDPAVDDVLDDIGEIVRQKGGEVLVLSATEMPSETGLAAIYRY